MSQAATDGDKLTIMARKFLSVRNEDSSYPKFYFFYGSLMDPGQLARVLRLRNLPVTLPASITGYSCKMWGPYPVLIDGPTDSTVQGVAFEVKSKQVAMRLAEYETDAYVEHDCIIRFENGDSLPGLTFKWSDSADDPDLREGNFNLREWQANNKR